MDIATQHRAAPRQSDPAPDNNLFNTNSTSFADKSSSNSIGDEVEQAAAKEQKEFRSQPRSFQPWSFSAYKAKGPAPERKWLVNNTIAMRGVTNLAAFGGAGKSLLALDLAKKVGDPNKGGFLNPTTAFGNEVSETGTALLVTSEDDADEVHRRLESLDYKGSEDAFVMPLPDAGGPAPLVVPGKSGPEASPAWFEFSEEIRRFKNLKMVCFDPLANFVMADINADPAVGAFTMGLLGSLAAETGAAVIVTHHLSKTLSNIKTPEQARAMIRGSTAIVDGARGAYALWGVSDEKEARNICFALDVEYCPNRVFKGAVVKSNGPADRAVKIFVRNDNGLLEIKNDQIHQATSVSNDLSLDTLANDIGSAAERGFPFTRTGQMGIYKMRERLTQSIRGLSRDKLQSLLNTLIDENRVRCCRAKGSTVEKWLDVRGGPFWNGEGVFSQGADDA